MNHGSLKGSDQPTALIRHFSFVWIPCDLRVKKHLGFCSRGEALIIGILKAAAATQEGDVIT